jgi:hypothetical protein
MAPSPSPPSGSGLRWALLINTLFWGGLFAGGKLVERLQQPRQLAQPPRPGQRQLNGTAQQDPPRVDRPSVDPSRVDLPRVDPWRQAGPPQPAASRQAAALAGVSRTLVPAPFSAELAPPAPGPLPLSGAEALGGEITLANLGQPRMLPAARAEQLRWQRSGDPLAPLPLHWRQRLKQELAGGPPIQQARLVRVPVQQLQEREEVAVVIDDGGSAEALTLPRQPQVRAAVETWASRQQPAPQGERQAVVIAAEPLPAEPVTIAVPIRSETAQPPAPAPEPGAGE